MTAEQSPAAIPKLLELQIWHVPWCVEEADAAAAKDVTWIASVGAQSLPASASSSQYSRLTSAILHELQKGLPERLLHHSHHGSREGLPASMQQGGMCNLFG